jgi:hypothetical protein
VVRLRDRRLLTALGLALLAALVRLHPFLEGNDDGDIGVYVLAGRAWLHGALPYTTIWEYKPPGLFALYAAALAVFGDGSRASAALGLLAGVATTLLLWRLVARLVPGGERAGLLAAILWACTSIENDGLLGDAELLTVPFAAASLLALAPGRAGGRAALWGGLLAAGAVQMKLSALPFAVLPLALALRRGGGGLAGFAAGFCAPPALEAVAYALAHRFDALWDANVGATARRLLARAALRVPPHDPWSQLRKLAPGIELAPFALLARGPGVTIFTAWLALGAATLVAVGEYDARHFVPLAAPLAALGGTGLDALLGRTRFARGLAIGAAAFAFALHGYFEVNSTLRTMWMRHVAGVPDWRISEGDRIARRLRAFPLGHERVWFVEATPLLYDRLGLAPPTRYPLSSNLLNRNLWPMLGRRGDDELDRVLDDERPGWIVMRRCGPWCDPATRDRLLARIRARYHAVAALDARTTVYRRDVRAEAAR